MIEWLGVLPNFDWMQGCFLPGPALKMYYHLGEDKEYLKLVYECLKNYDAYLWAYRDSTGDGCLENWCVWDVGEDNSTVFMLNGIKMSECGKWGKSTPPEDAGNLPHKSPQYMAYSYACRDVLSRISRIFENGEEEEWRKKAQEVQKKATQRLWDTRRHAFFLRDKDDKVIDALTQENIKCMYCGLFTKEQADQFLEEHFFNEKEFWTPSPLPAIAANDPYFHVDEQYSNCADRLEMTEAEAKAIPPVKR